MAARTMQRGSQREPARGGMARAAARQAREQIEDRIAAERSSVARQVMGVAQALRATAAQLEEFDQVPFASYAQRAADVTERLGEAIESRTLSEIISDVERVSRQQPLVAGAVAAAVGFVAARVARSSIDEAGAMPATRPRGGRRGARSQPRR